MSMGGGEVPFKIEGQIRVRALVWKEGRNTSSYTRCIIVGKSCQRELLSPVVLLVIIVDPEVLFKCLISSLSLAITFQMVPGGEV